MVPYFNSQQIY